MPAMPSLPPSIADAYAVSARSEPLTKPSEHVVAFSSLLPPTTRSPLSPSSGYGYYPIDATHVLGIAVSDDQTGILMLEGVTVAKTK